MKITQQKLIFISSLYLLLFFNFSFFTNLVNTYSFEGMNSVYIISIGLVLLALFNLLFTIVSSKYTTKIILVFIFIVSSFTAYFMDTYHVIIDSEMIRNTLQTNLSEASDLFSFKQVGYFLLLGLFPSYFVYKSKIINKPIQKELFEKLKVLLICLSLIAIIILSFSKFYASFFREHKPLRFTINPIYWIYSIGKYVNKTIDSGPIIIKEIGKDSKVVENSDKKELIIMVVGETARADRFSLNGYTKETTPLLNQESIINFSKMKSCGTSTAVSVPCMFSIYNKDDYDYKKGISTYNVVDILNNTQNINILWRDNNSDSKGVALRVDYEDFRTSKNNTICEGTECRDEGMLVGLDKYIEDHNNKDILIVLHQMGNHGPAYYKRYPKEFEKFTPVCKTNQLEECSKEEVNNAYDNAILYTDYFLSKVINFLKPYSKTHETAMLYMSDHGESLGENGLYLHGMPYFMAPLEQTHIPAILYLGEGDMRNDYNIQKLNEISKNEFSQDNLFHTLLGLFEVKTEVYKKNMDILYDSKID